MSEGTIPFLKLEWDGRVSVLYSPGYGAGWYTWNCDPANEGPLKNEGLLFDREIVEPVLADDLNMAGTIAKKKYPGVYLGGVNDLGVEWLPKGERFMITEFDGDETVIIFGPNIGHVA